MVCNKADRQTGNKVMINISDVVKSWPVDEAGWSISTGTNFCELGNKVKLGDGVKLGNGVKLGDWVKLGSWVKLGDGCTYARDLGVQSGYRHVLAVINGEIKFVGGCHTFSFAEARQYWKGKLDRVETLLAVDFAEKLAAVIPETKDLPH